MKKILLFLAVSVIAIASFFYFNRESEHTITETREAETTLVAAEQPSEVSRFETLLPLHIGVMPAVDSAPFWWAEKTGLYEKYGLNVHIELFTNAASQQGASQSGQLDGIMASLVEAVANRENDERYGKITMSTDGVFQAVASPKYDGKKEIKIGLMEVSVTNFVADKYLKDYVMEKLFINEIPVRMQMLAAGEIDMAILPEPMSSNAQSKGMQKIDLDTKDEMMNVMVFRPETIASKSEELKLFHQIYAEAVESMRGREEEVRTLLVEKINLPSDISSLITLPAYRTPHLPSEELLKQAQDWMSHLSGKNMVLPYETFVDGTFLPVLP